MRNPMLGSERQEEILKIAGQNKYLDVNTLSKQFQVSRITIYRDLKKLERRNKILKIHGGAKFADDNSPEPAFTTRKDKNVNQKVKAAANAVTLIRNNDTIMLDSSSTSLFIAREIVKQKFSLTIITNNIDIAFETINQNNIQTILMGGNLREITRSIVGPLTIEFLAKMNADKFFFSCIGITKEKGVTDTNLDEIAVKKQMAAVSRNSYCVINSEKIGQVGVYPLFSFDEVAYFVTDKQIIEQSEKLFNKCKLRGSSKK